MKILGVDHGTRFSGFAIYDSVGDQFKEMGKFDLTSFNFDTTMLYMFKEVSELIKRERINCLAVEKPMAMKNADTARKLIQVYTAVMMAGLTLGIKVVEITPQQAKIAATGHGNADKEDVAKMISLRFDLKYDQLAVPVYFRDKKRIGQVKERLFEPSDSCALCLGAVALMKVGAL